MTIRQDEYDRAEKIVKKWTEQQAEKARRRRGEERLALEALYEELGNDPNLKTWALQQWERDKERGIGKGMSEVQATSYYLRCLKDHVIFICQAYSVEMPYITSLPLKID